MSSWQFWFSPAGWHQEIEHCEYLILFVDHLCTSNGDGRVKRNQPDNEFYPWNSSVCWRWIDGISTSGSVRQWCDFWYEPNSFSRWWWWWSCMKRSWKSTEPDRVKWTGNRRRPKSKRELHRHSRFSCRHELSNSRRRVDYHRSAFRESSRYLEGTAELKRTSWKWTTKLRRERNTHVSHRGELDDGLFTNNERVSKG